jgi:7,8-dihydro-6-hydroxymethylpterin-pyrophosphokinase
VKVLGVEREVQFSQEELALWERRAKYRNFAKLPLFDEIASDSAHPVEPKVNESLVTHLDNLKINIERIIPIGSTGGIWVSSSFIIYLEEIDDTVT